MYHGNEDTYGDYMKAKRTVELRFSVVTPMNMVASEGMGGDDEDMKEGGEGINF